MTTVEKERKAWSGEISWLCEKWSEDAVDFARRHLESEGVTHIESSVMLKPTGVRDRLASLIAGRDVSQLIAVPSFIPIEHGISSAELRRIVGDAEATVEVSSNLLLNEGIQRLEDLLIAAGGVAYNNAGSYIGVGDSVTAEAASQTDLIAATNHFYKAMNATFPSRASQTVTWQSDFTSAEANYAWAEWSISAGATGASGSGFLVGTTNLNRKVQALGTKVTGTWTLSGAVTIS